MPRRAHRRLCPVLISLVLVAAGLTGRSAGAAPRLWEADPAFGAQGTVRLTTPNGKGTVEDFVAAPGGGTILVGARYVSGQSDATVTRLRPDGSPDPTFGDAGEVVINLGLGEYGMAAAVQPDGKIVVAGKRTGSSSETVFVARLLPGGARDTGFAGDGIFDFAVPAHFHHPSAVAVGLDGGIVVTGWINLGGPDQVDTFVLRLTATGEADPIFGDHGIAITPAGPVNGAQRFEYPHALALTPTGGVLVVGHVANSQVPDNGILMLRYGRDGRLDPTFGGTGIVIPRNDSDSVYDNASDVVLLPDGSALIAGTTGTLVGDGNDRGHFVARVDVAGRLDPDFGLGAGHVAPDFYAPTSGKGKLFPMGDRGWYVVGSSGQTAAAGLARFDSAGRPDAMFGLGGYEKVPLPGTDTSNWAALRDGDGRFLLAGATVTGGDRFVSRLRERSTPAGPPPAPTVPAVGYWLLEASGVVHAFGGVHVLGHGPSDGGPWIDIEPTPSGKGYRLLGGRGELACFGDAGPDCGSIGRLPDTETPVSLSGTPSGRGGWVFTRTGRVFPFGDAASFGDLAQMRLNRPIGGSVATPSGRGYFMVADDGGIFAFGDAVFRGSMGGHKLNKPVMSLVPTPDGRGYWLVASDGGVFAFDAPFKGSMASVPLNRPVVGMVPFGGGYMMVGEDGGIFNFSDHPFFGSLGGRAGGVPIIAVATAGDR